jgi:hypothetical protein
MTALSPWRPFGAEHWFAKPQLTEMIFGERGFMALKPPNIKDCSKLTLWRMGIFTRRTAVAGDFRKNTTVRWSTF